MRRFVHTALFILLLTTFVFQIDAAAAGEVGNSAPAIIFSDSARFAVDLVDKDRAEGKLVVYTCGYGSFTKPFSGGTCEFVVVNNIVIDKSTSEATGTYIPPNGCVISYTGDNTELLSRLSPGCELSVQGISFPAIPDKYFTMQGLLVPIDKVNSIRDANQVILYDQAYGESTKTNMWGIELTVVDGVITYIADISDNKDIPSGSNSAIPENGIVLSIHVGSPYYKQLHGKVKPGDAVKVYAEDKLYNASKLGYAAYDPKTISDNPAAWDKTENKPYDGFRGPNQLIIYDSSYGESTGTNPYGYEVAVDSRGMITSAGGNDLAIPAGGYVLSGHGESLKWLEKYASLGASVIINKEKKEVTILLSPGSYLNRAAYSIKNAADSLELAKQQYLDIDYDKAAELISKGQERYKDLEIQLSQGGYESLAKSAREIQGIADNAWYTTFESEKVENRAVWLRPRDTSIEQIKKRLDKLKELNINILYLETYWGGYAIYPTGNPVLKHNPMFNGMDILEVYLKEAHARGMEVHAWVENFLAGPPVAESKPDWMAVSRKGETWYLENGTTKYYFMNPANPEVRDFLSGLYKNLIKKYNLDGIQFDYMRYSHSGDYTNDFGYDSYTRQLFSNYTGTDPIGLKPGDPLWEEWCSFRTQLVSSYAYRVISEVKSLKPRLKVSADVWPEYDETLVDIFQDPKAWVRNDYINNLIPMSYYLHEDPVVDDIMKSLEFSRGHSQITSGIATFNKVDPKVFLRQVNAIRSSNTKGISIFEFESLFSGNYDEVLKPGVFSTPAVVADRNPKEAISLILNNIVRKLDAIYLKRGGITSEQAEKYKHMVLQGRAELPADGNIDEKTALSIKDNIEVLINAVYKDESLNREVAGRMTYDLNSALNIIGGYISDNRFLKGHEAVRFQLELPFGEIKEGSTVPFKVKALFDDNSFAYLDSSQYRIKSSDNAAVDIAGSSLIIKKNAIDTKISIYVLDAFKFNPAKGVDRNFTVLINSSDSTVQASDYGSLRAPAVSFTSIKLDWGSAVSDPAVSGYIIYCNDQELTRTAFDNYSHRELEPGESYTYYIKGFDINGKVIFESSKITVKAKAHPLLISE